MSSTDRLIETDTDAVANRCPVAPAVPKAEGDAVCPAGAKQATNAFSISIMVSGIRCMLTYIVFPWALPLLGLAAGIGSVIGLVFGVLAIGSNVLSIRRMWATDFTWKWPISIINAGIIVLLLILIGLDIADLA